MNHLAFDNSKIDQLKKSCQDLTHVFCFNSRCLDMRCKAVFPCLKIFALWRFTKISNLPSFGLIKQFFQITRTRSQLYQLKNLYLPLLSSKAEIHYNCTDTLFFISLRIRKNLTYLVFSHLREPSMVKPPTAIELCLRPKSL